MEIKYVRNNIFESIIINEFYIDHYYFKHKPDYNNDIDIINILNNFLYDLNCTKVYNGKQASSTKDLLYNSRINEYYYYLQYITNYILYNKYLDKLIQQHIDNLNFEETFIPIEEPKKKSKRKNKTKYTKTISKDIFTGEVIEFYDDLKNNKSKRKRKKSEDNDIKNIKIKFNFSL